MGSLRVHEGHFVKGKEGTCPAEAPERPRQSGGHFPSLPAESVWSPKWHAGLDESKGLMQW